MSGLDSRAGHLGNPFNWYFFLKTKAAEGRREFKRDAIETFFSIDETDRQQIIKTLRNVRIHISDPRPYTAQVSAPLRKILPKGTSVPNFLKRLDDSTRHLEEIQRKVIAAVATRMLQDSPPERLKFRYKIWEYITEIRRPAVGKSTYMDFPMEPEPESAFDFTPFQHKKANVLRDIANFSCASASVFSTAIDRFDEARADYLFASPMAGPYLIYNALSRSHAFDEGNRQAVKWIEQRRADVLAQTDRKNYFYPGSLPEPLQELPSTESMPIQAADIAASIARELWHRNNLPYLALHFDYVTYNGERLSEDQAASYQRIISASLN